MALEKQSTQAKFSVSTVEVIGVKVMDFMTQKQRETRSKIIASHSNREAVKRFASQINTAHELLEKGKIISESDLGVSRRQFKNVLVALKARHKVDVLTINRGNQAIGWVLAKEILKDEQSTLQQS